VGKGGREHSSKHGIKTLKDNQFSEIIKNYGI
jgi:hypothetical protein